MEEVSQKNSVSETPNTLSVLKITSPRTEAQVAKQNLSKNLIKVRTDMLQNSTPSTVSAEQKSILRRIVVRKPLQTVARSQNSRKFVSNNPESLNLAGVGNVIVKRLGNTTIKSLNPNAVKTGLVKLSNGTYRVPEPVYAAAAATTNQSPPKMVTAKGQTPAVDPRDSVIKALQDQNKQLRLALLECRREAHLVQLKMRRWTTTINDLLTKVPRVPGLKTVKCVKTPETRKPLTQEKSPFLLSPGKNQAMPSQLKKATATKPDIVYRTPAFPIKNLNTLKQFEMDLKNRDYFEFIVRKLMGNFSKVSIEKPSIVLSFVLQSLFNPTLLGNFIWDASHPITPNSAPLVFSNMKNLRAIYMRLVNGMSMLLYKKNLDSVAVDLFLKGKLNAQSKNSQAPAQSVNVPMVVPVQVKTETIDDIGSDITWLGEDSEMGNEILGDEQIENDEDGDQVED